MNDRDLQLAFEHHSAGRLGEAERLLRAILAAQPGHEKALHLLGVLAGQMGHYTAAVDLLERVLTMNPTDALAARHLGVALRRQGRTEEAVAAFRRAIVLKPDYAEAHDNLSLALRDKGQIDEALAAVHRAMALDPHLPGVHNTLGVALEDKGRFDEAAAAYHQAIALNPNMAEAHLNLAEMLLSEGRFTEGWEEFEWRLRVQPKALDRDFPQPRWDGATAPGQTILIYTEGEGFGDALSFIRLVPLVRERVGKVVLECQSELLRLFGDVAGVDQCVARGGPLPPFDYRISLQSLPRVLGICLETLAHFVPYLKSPREKIMNWRERIPHDGIKNIGLCWAGKPRAEVERRSRTIDVFSPLAKIAGVRFFSMQKGAEAKQAPPQGMALTDHTSEINDFADTAAMIENLDLVISVDTSIAHLAGALGKPVWVLIPKRTYYFWMRNRLDSPWYPTMRLFRQSNPDEWESVVEKMAEALDRGEP